MESFVNITRRNLTLGGLSLLGVASLSTLARAEFGGAFEGIREGLDDFVLATDAYVFGYPLVTMEMTRRIITNVAKPEGTRAPMGQMIKLREYPNASFRDVTAPNADTLYTTSFVDVGKEPWVIGIPDMKGRYFLLPMLDGWTNVFQVPGKRTTGTGAQTYAITGPGWKGTLPAGVKEYKSPTAIVWLLGRGESLRFAELQRQLPGDVSAKVLSARLKELETLDMVARDDKGTNPPHVEYRLTAYGRSIDGLLENLELKARGLALPVMSQDPRPEKAIEI